jgi:hypothetical protein
MDGEKARAATEVFLPTLGSLNPKQRQVLDGVITTLKSIEDDHDAVEWLQKSRERILDELTRLS